MIFPILSPLVGASPSSYCTNEVVFPDRLGDVRGIARRGRLRPPLTIGEAIRRA